MKTSQMGKGKVIFSELAIEQGSQPLSLCPGRDSKTGKCKSFPVETGKGFGYTLMVGMGKQGKLTRNKASFVVGGIHIYLSLVLIWKQDKNLGSWQLLIKC